ncbi:uncharacterized protein LOC129576516 [Sitodiplosis mosellana]|uniref:uncharacterized protein LOC129576516 n=1 Tax=Sitodiplosis mosellana TaxID=263140 RepID=UPI002443C2BA|nr:uncharacterized protein LOC129576516 [Sitodiplosis mosellana]
MAFGCEMINPISIVIMCALFSTAIAIDESSNGTIQICEIEDPMSDGINQCTHLICPNLHSSAQWRQHGDCVVARKMYPYLKILYSITHTPNELSAILGDKEKREEFIKQAYNDVSSNNFVGLYLNLQHTAVRWTETKESIDNETLVSLLKELKQMFEPTGLLLIISFNIVITKEMMPTYLTFYTSSNRYYYMYDFVSISKYVDYMVYRPEFWQENDRFNQYDDLILMGVPSRKIIMKLGQLRVAQWLDANAIRFGTERNLGGAFYSIVKALPKTETKKDVVHRVDKNNTIELVKSVLNAIVVLIDIILELIEKFYPDFRK